MSGAFACWLVLSKEAYESFHACHLQLVACRQSTTIEVFGGRFARGAGAYSPPLVPTSDGLSTLFRQRAGALATTPEERRTQRCNVGRGPAHRLEGFHRRVVLEHDVLDENLSASRSSQRQRCSLSQCNCSSNRGRVANRRGRSRTIWPPSAVEVGVPSLGFRTGPLI